VANADVILVFWDDMTCRTLVHELSREQPKSTNELLDITTDSPLSKRQLGQLLS
jgi:hypothetical protein